MKREEECDPERADKLVFLLLLPGTGLWLSQSPMKRQISPRAAADTRHSCGCRCTPYVLPPAPKGGEVIRPGCLLSSSGVSHPIPCRDAPGSSSPPFQLQAAASASLSDSPGAARPAGETSPSLLFSLPAASSRASDGESVTVS